MNRRELGLHRHAATGLRAQLDMLSPIFRQAIRAASDAYRAGGVRHALIGGMAVGAFGRPRATRDIDFLVGDEAFVQSGLLVSFKPGLPIEAVGVPIDSIPIPDAHRALFERILDGAGPSDEPGVLTVTAEGLVATKLVSGRTIDEADILSLLTDNRIDVPVLLAFLPPDLGEAFLRIAKKVNA